MLREAGIPLFLIIGILALLFMLFSDSIYIVSSCDLFLYSFAIIVLNIYMSYCSVIGLS